MLDRTVRRGYVQRLEGDRFSLTLKMFGLAHFHAPVRRLVSFAAPVMRDFSASAEQACHLAVYDRGSVVVIAQQESSTYWAMSMRVGAQMSLFQTGSGHVLLAFQNEVQRKIMITEQVRGGGETEPSDLEERLAEVRRNGFESMDSMQTAGVRNISARCLHLMVPHLPSSPALYHPLGGKAPTREACEVLIRDAARRISEVATGQGTI